MTVVVSDNAITRLEIYVQMMDTYVTGESGDSIILQSSQFPSYQHEFSTIYT